MVRVHGYWLQKAGNTPEEYEDAFFPRWSGEVEAWYFRAAAADGATETSFAGAWAGELAEAYGRRRLDCQAVADRLPRIQRRWASRFNSSQLPWYAQEKLRLGAFSSLLGLTLLDTGDGNVHAWQAMALGDTCLFQVRGDSLVTAWPLDEPEAFSSRPRLISSLAPGNTSTAEALQAISGTWEPGDSMLLMTDALAQWFLRSSRSGGRPWRVLIRAQGEQARFARSMHQLRERNEIRNDDVTALVIDLL